MTAKEILARRREIERQYDSAKAELEKKLPRAEFTNVTARLESSGDIYLTSGVLIAQESKAFYDWLGELKPWEK